MTLLKSLIEFYLLIKWVLEWVIKRKGERWKNRKLDYFVRFLKIYQKRAQNTLFTHKNRPWRKKQSSFGNCVFGNNSAWTNWNDKSTTKTKCSCLNVIFISKILNDLKKLLPFKYFLVMEVMRSMTPRISNFVKNTTAYQLNQDEWFSLFLFIVIYC